MRGAGLGTAATATVHRVGLPTPEGGHGKSPQNVHQGTDFTAALRAQQQTHPIFASSD